MYALGTLKRPVVNILFVILSMLLSVSILSALGKPKLTGWQMTSFVSGIGIGPGDKNEIHGRIFVSYKNTKSSHWIGASLRSKDGKIFDLEPKKCAKDEGEAIWEFSEPNPLKGDYRVSLWEGYDGRYMNGRLDDTDWVSYNLTPQE